MNLTTPDGRHIGTLEIVGGSVWFTLPHTVRGTLEKRLDIRVKVVNEELNKEAVVFFDVDNWSRSMEGISATVTKQTPDGKRDIRRQVQFRLQPRR